MRASCPPHGSANNSARERSGRRREQRAGGTAIERGGARAQQRETGGACCWIMVAARPGATTPSADTQRVLLTRTQATAASVRLPRRTRQLSVRRRGSPTTPTVTPPCLHTFAIRGMIVTDTTADTASAEATVPQAWPCAKRKRACGDRRARCLSHANEASGEGPHSTGPRRSPATVCMHTCRRIECPATHTWRLQTRAPSPRPRP